MRYELLLQPEPGQPYDGAAIEAALVAKGALTEAPTGRTWRLVGGEVEVGELREGGVARATELRVPLTHDPELLRALLAVAIEVAQAAHVRLVDLQLAKAITLSDEGAVLAQYERLARYAGQYGGESSAVMVGFQAPAQGLKAGTKVALALGALLLLAFWLFDRLTS